ncbi:fmp32, mitochondrial-like protein [Drosera capensis]
MAAAASIARRRTIQVASSSPTMLSLPPPPSSSPCSCGFEPMLRALRIGGHRRMSQLLQRNRKRLFIVDTLALVRSLEKKGVPLKEAEAVTSVITQVVNDSLQNVASRYVSKADMQRMEIIQETNDAKLKSEVRSSQDQPFSLLQIEIENFHAEIEKLRSELKHEIDKVTAGLHLDLNVDRGRTHDELTNQKAETADLTNKLDREIHALRAEVQAAKYDVIKYCIGTLISVSAVGLAAARILL